ncbi:MAG: hypothetical protein AAGH64_08360, partial [Planctomycetota bacterium]
MQCSVVPSFAAALSIVCSATTCFGQGLSDLVASEPGEIPAAETREWASLFWHWNDTGTVSELADGFVASNHPVRGNNHNYLIETYLLFKELYSHRLQLDPDLPAYYDLDDLLADDPDVFAEFRAYSLTAVLVTDDRNADPTTAAKHVELIEQAEIFECEEVGAYWIDVADDSGDTLTVASEGLAVVTRKPKKCKPTAPGNPNTPSTIPDELRLPVEQFPRYDMPLEIWNYPDGLFPWSDPGFDCDDWADMLAKYLRRLLEDDIDDFAVWQFWATWIGDGHVITVVNVSPESSA